MSERSARADEILDVAERMARSGGYNAFSFREIAKEIGIKAASVHYHFPGKEDLAAVLARRYTDRFVAGLGEPSPATSSPEAQLRTFIDAYRGSAASDGQMCLCGVLGAQADHLPKTVTHEVKRFFELNIAWLTAALRPLQPTGKGPVGGGRAQHILATLEGALILARTLEDPSLFDAAVEQLV